MQLNESEGTTKMDIVRIRQSLVELNDSGRLEGKQIYILGANDEAACFIDVLGSNRIQAIIDGNENLRGLTLCGRPIKCLQDELVPYSPHKVVLLTNAFTGRDIDQLNMIGYFHGTQRFWVCEPIRYKEADATRLIRKIRNYGIFKLISSYIRLRNAEKLLIDLYKNGIRHILFTPYPSVGDVYIYGQYLRDGKIRNDEATVLLVCGNACKMMAIECGFKKVISLTQDIMSEICKLKCVVDTQLESLESLHYDYYPPVSIMLASVYRNKVTFDELFKRIKFNSDYSLTRKIINQSNESVLSYCRKYGIEKNNSIILAPYAKSVPPISFVFWENLAVKLKRTGYKVFTNTGSTSEVNIPGTIAISPPFTLIGEVVEYAGAIIALRSGLCDICSYTSAKKVVLYPRRAWEYGEDYINHVGFSNFPEISHLIELECDQVPNNGFIDKVIQTLMDT